MAKKKPPAIREKETNKTLVFIILWILGSALLGAGLNAIHAPGELIVILILGFTGFLVWLYRKLA